MEKNKEAIVILGGSLIKDNNKWRTTNFNEGDNFGLSGDRLRVVAASYLYRKGANQLFIALGGKGQLKNIPKAVPVAKIIRQELIELDVPKGKIIIEVKSGNTYQQLRALQIIIKEKKLPNVVIISNKHHFPRLKAMIEYNPALLALKRMLYSSQINFKSAEEIVMKYQPKIFGKIISRAYKSRAMKERIKLEQRGVKQIKNGTYKFK
jgi:DNA-binding protein